MLDKLRLSMQAKWKLSGDGGGLFAADRAEEAISFYDEVRRVDPVLRLDDGMWLITRYDDAKAILRDNVRFSSKFDEGQDGNGDDDPNLTASILGLDPPDHTRLRALVQKAFLPRRINRLEGDIERAVDSLLGAVASKGRMDVIADLARPLPVWVICTMLDVPECDRDKIQKLAQDSSLYLDYEFIDEEARQRTLSASEELRVYFDTLIDKRSENLGDDILSGLIAAESDGQRMTKQEVVTMADLLFVAGHETTVNLIGNGTRTMLDHPGTLERLADEPDLIPSAVEECLRYTPSVTLNGRTATEAVETGDKSVAEGDYVMIPMDAVNRDPARFSDPHRFDIARTDNAHLTFSIGPHICLGASLARLEARIVWRKLLGRFSNIKPTAPSAWREHITLRGLESLNVSFEAAS